LKEEILHILESAAEKKLNDVQVIISTLISTLTKILRGQYEETEDDNSGDVDDADN